VTDRSNIKRHDPSLNAVGNPSRPVAQHFTACHEPLDERGCGLEYRDTPSFPGTVVILYCLAAAAFLAAVPLSFLSGSGLVLGL
jgi:hypothetical protein